MSGAVEPCAACLYVEVPAFSEPCKGCISDSPQRDTYMNFVLRPGQVGIDPARPGSDETIIRVVHTPVDPIPVEFVAPTGYSALADVLTRAMYQASAGKGAQRHAQGQAFEQQPMQQLIKLYGVGFALGQAAKKAQEAQRLPTVERQVAELLGAIVYIAGAVIALEGKS